MYRKENSGPNEEYCFKRSRTYRAECQDNAEGGEEAVEIPGEWRCDINEGKLKGQRLTFFFTQTLFSKNELKIVEL